VTVTECQNFQFVCLFVGAMGGKGIIQTIAAKYDTEEIKDTGFHFRLGNLCFSWLSVCTPCNRSNVDRRSYRLFLYLLELY
jgi:hypothetical protein